MEHHPIFSHFKPEVEFISDSFLGTVSRREFTSEAMQEKVCARGPAGLPAFNEEYFEWIDLLESIAAWKAGSGPWTFMELGAGYGRWSVRAAFARPLARIIAVEAEPTHFAWMLQNFKDNVIQADRHNLVNAAVSDKPGECLFHVGRPAEWYGQCIADPEVKDLRCPPPVAATPCVTIPGLLEYVSCVDLIDMDIQGHEFAVLSSAIETLNAKVKCLHIATHSREIESNLRLMLLDEDWTCIRAYAGDSLQVTDFGPIEFQDGVQSWINTRLA